MRWGYIGNQSERGVKQRQQLLFLEEPEKRGRGGFIADRARARKLRGPGIKRKGD